jgi:hypothetical protein
MITISGPEYFLESIGLINKILGYRDWERKDRKMSTNWTKAVKGLYNPEISPSGSGQEMRGS